MGEKPTREPLHVGEAAPDFSAPAVYREGPIGLRDYKGRKPLLIGLFRGLHCPFCRREVARMGGYADRLNQQGVEVLAVINTTLDRARVYYGHRPMNMMLAADPEWETHRRFGMQLIAPTEEKSQWPKTVNLAELMALRVNPSGDWPEPMSPLAANEVINRSQGFEPTSTDIEIMGKYALTSAGYYLLGRDGVVRWLFVEGLQGMETLTAFPSPDDVLAAVSAAKL